MGVSYLVLTLTTSSDSSSFDPAAAIATFGAVPCMASLEEDIERMGERKIT